MRDRAANLKRANSVLGMLSRINRTIVRAESPDELYETACRIAVDSSLFRFAWIGLTDAVSGQLRIISSAGNIADLHGRLVLPDGALDSVNRSGKLQIFDDPAALTGMKSERLRERGIGAMAVLPLHEGDHMIGLFVLCADSTRCFDPTVVALLDEVRADLSFCLTNLHNEQHRLAAQSRLDYLAFYDAQTGMPNRALLEERLPVLAERAGQHGTFLTVFDIRLKRLDNVVQLFGNFALDELMRTLALRLESCRGEDGMLARLAHDEFALVSLAMKRAGDIDPFVQQLQQLLEQPVRIGDREIFPHAAIGGVMYQLHEHDQSYLLRRARAAADRSMLDGGFKLYHSGLDRGLEQQVQMESELHRALERSEFLLHYQPQLDMRTGKINGVEALLRWQHPERGLVLPGQFVALLEDCGLMPKVGAWVLREACRQASEWRRQGLPPLRMAVNLSAQQFRLASLVAAVRSALEDTQLEADFLELELTESLILENAERTIQAMHQLKALGLSLSLDDFGTGYSSLGYLRRYPVDRIKIDQTFVRDMTEHAGSAALVRSILAMASNLGLKTIAEGVETPSQFGYLRRQLCHEMQGNLFSRPLPPEALAALLRSGGHLDIDDDVCAGSCTLLLVDDDPNMLEALQRCLRRENWQVLTAGSGAEALEKLALQEVGVVISDQRMSGMSGIELLHRVQEMYPDTMRMLLTGYADFDTLVGAVNRGGLFRVLSKPIGDDALREHIREAFRRYEVYVENRRLARRVEALEQERTNQETI